MAKYLIDAGPAREHLHGLLAAGRNLSAVSCATGVADDQVRRIARGLVRRCVRANAAAILALDPTSIDPYPDGACITAVGAGRRFDALRLEGWSTRQVARHIGWVSHKGVMELSRPGVETTVGTIRRIQEVYVRLSWLQPPQGSVQQRGAVTRVQAGARAAGYAPRLAWDDDTIDDLRAEPAACDRASAPQPKRDLLDPRDIQNLLAAGWSDALIAQQQGRPLDTVQAVIRRHKLRETAA